MKVALVGFMGSGKTTVAAELSSRFDLPLVEMDEEIIKRSKRASVSEIFEKDGEKRFRALEAEVCRELGKRADVVISCGGGVVQDRASVAELRRDNGKVIYLRTRFETIEQRLRGDASRPLFKDLARAKQLYLERAGLYEAAATLIVDTDACSPAQVADKIAVLLT